MKSCSTSFFQLENNKVQKVSILFFHVNLCLVVSQLLNISGLVNKSLMGFQFGFKNFRMLVQKYPRGGAFFSSNQFTKEFPYNFEHEPASHTKQKIQVKPSKQYTQIAKQSKARKLKVFFLNFYGACPLAGKHAI